MLITQADCTDFMCDTLASESVDLVIADPPFNINAKYDIYNDNVDDKRYAFWTRKWIWAALRVLKPTGSIVVFINCENNYWVERALRQTLTTLYRRGCWIWYYTFGQHQKTKLTRSHTHIHWWSKDADNYTFNADDIRVPSARQLKYKDRRADPKGRVPDDVFTFSRICGTFDERIKEVPTQSPLDLCEFIIKMTTNPGDIVYDPFCGSGSTLVAARRLGREIIGTDISEKYVEITRERLKGIR